MPIGETLVNKGIITQDQLAKALEAQKKEPGKRLGEILVNMGFIDDAALTKAMG